MAIKYNDVIRKIDEDGPYFGGRYFVGLGMVARSFLNIIYILDPHRFELSQISRNLATDGFS